MQIYNVGIIRKGHHKIRNRGTDIADHDTAYHQHGHLPHPPCDHQHKAHGNHRSGKGRQNHGRGAHKETFPQKQDHDQSHHQLGPGRNAQHKRSRNGICKKGLKQKTRCGKSSAKQCRRKKARKSDIPQNMKGSALPVRPGQNCLYVLKGKRNTPHADAECCQNDQQKQ